MGLLATDLRRVAFPWEGGRHLVTCARQMRASQVHIPVISVLDGRQQSSVELPAVCRRATERQRTAAGGSRRVGLGSESITAEQLSGESSAWPSRAIVNNPSVLLADDPRVRSTAGRSPTFLRSSRPRRRGTSVVVITHNLVAINTGAHRRPCEDRKVCDLR
jgi:ABC-type lipoprotein export system ATPase subunit